jgi:leucyl aminopeptidase
VAKFIYFGRQYTGQNNWVGAFYKDMDIQLTNQALKDVECDVLVLGSGRSKESQGTNATVLTATAQSIDSALDGLLSEIIHAGEFKGNAGELCTIYPMGKVAARRILLVGLGVQDKLDVQALQRASAMAARHAQQTGAHSIALSVLAQAEHIDAARAVQAEVEGVLLGTYTFKKYKKSEDNSNGRGISALTLLANNSNELNEAVKRGSAMAEATNFARDLINEPPNVLTPTELANRASAMAKQFGLECEIWDRPKMQEMGMGGLLGVAQGSVEPPKFIILRYRGAPQNTKGMALVGKGITFDTGGISIKPAAGMETMKGDMGGAAAVIGAMQAIAALKPAINVTVLVSTTENMPSGSAYRPGDILRIMNGKTIEIVNTDAEGRLVLADALSYATREGLSPIIDVATLTGAIVVALGSKMTGMYCTDEQLCEHIVAAGRAEGEKYWPMPLDDDYAEQIASEVADIKQTGGREAGSVTAAKILQNFVSEDAQWAHLDIAGTFFLDSKKPYAEKGATGTAVRTLAELALRLAK